LPCEVYQALHTSVALRSEPETGVPQALFHNQTRIPVSATAGGFAVRQDGRFLVVNSAVQIERQARGQRRAGSPPHW
jgi:hypothetical protein